MKTRYSWKTIGIVMALAGCAIMILPLAVVCAWEGQSGLHAKSAENNAPLLYTAPKGAARFLVTDINAPVKTPDGKDTLPLLKDEWITRQQAPKPAPQPDSL